jgi:hypothetical protein
MLAIMLLALSLDQADAELEERAEIIHRVVTAAAASTLDPSVIDMDPGPAELTGIRVTDGLVVAVKPGVAAKRAYLAYARFCESASDFIDGSLLLPGETAQTFVQRNTTFLMRGEPSQYALCLPVGMEMTQTGVATPNAPSVMTSGGRLARHLLVWAEFLRKNDLDPDRWRAFVLAALEQERLALTEEARGADVARLGTSLSLYDDSPRSALVGALEPRDARERAAIVEYLSFVTRSRRKLQIFYTDKQREPLARDEALLARFRSAGAPQ